MEIEFLTWFTGSQMSFQGKVCLKSELVSFTVIRVRQSLWLVEGYQCYKEF